MFTFESWLEAFGRSYVGAELVHRRGVWLDNHKFIVDWNARNLSYTLGHNQFSDLSSEEFSSLLGFRGRGFTGTLIEGSVDSVGSASSVDWVSLGGVTGVKNQGSCGSCWAFSTTGAMEGALFVKTGELVSLSEQQLVDCDDVDSGCNGGLMDNAFEWISGNGGICSEESYSYTGKEGSCQACSIVSGTEVVGWADVKSNDQASMEAAVSKQPVSVAIQANQRGFQLYQSGVFDGRCGDRLDHGVLLVGYGTDGQDYWKVKNSWGTTWGEGGYIRMARGTQNHCDTCGILCEGSYPLL